jgi:diguanylate cyclase (GGDEF)-like protein
LTSALAKIEQLAMTDPLTKLSNRRHILSNIENEIVRSQRLKKSFCIILCDIDHFKRFNDSWGHDCGDFILVSIANIFKNMLRNQDYIARWGGEEFLLVLPETTIEGAVFVAEKLRSRIEATDFHLHGNKFSVTLTFGVKLFSEETGVDGCIKQADEALYYGKETGRNKIVAFETMNNVGL